jgi:ferredoxin-NADP reductase
MRGANLFSTTLRDRSWLSEKAFQIALDRPRGFGFVPGQSITMVSGPAEKDYSLSCAPDSPHLTLCIRHVLQGLLSPFLATAPLGSSLTWTGPHGYFTFRPSLRPAVFAATGTGVAPFLAMVGGGVNGFIMLHGVRTTDELYYESFFRAAAARYVPCLSEGGATGRFSGRVTDWAIENLSPASYDFYLCGNREMIRDMTLLADERFPDSLVYTEVFH